MVKGVPWGRNGVYREVSINNNKTTNYYYFVTTTRVSRTVTPGKDNNCHQVSQFKQTVAPILSFESFSRQGSNQHELMD